MRWVRRDDLDDFPSVEEPPRDERLRELVDSLPKQESLIVSLMYFGAGSPTVKSAALSMGITEYHAKVVLKRAHQKLKELCEADGLGPMPAADDL